MKYSLIIFFGITAFLLKPLVFAAEPSYYQFPAGSCYKLQDYVWSQSQGSCESEKRAYEISGALDAFCLYELKTKEPLKSITRKLGFLRQLETTRLSLTNTGVIMTNGFIRKGAKLLFYKGDILKSKDTSLCRNPTKVDMYSSFYALSYPATFYVMRPLLKKVNGSNVKSQYKLSKTDPFIKLREKINPKLKLDNSYTETESFFTKENELNVVVGAFYESFKGTQISNSSQAEIVNELSFYFTSEYLYELTHQWRLGLKLGAEFHSFNDRAGQLRIENEGISSFSVMTSQAYMISSRFKIQTYIGAVEDLYYERATALSLRIKKDLVPRLGVGFKLALIKFNKLEIGIEPVGFYDLQGSEFKSGVGFDIPLFVSIQNTSFKFKSKIGYNNRDKELDDLELDYSRYYLELGLGFDI